jgi:Ca2+-binding RTX toxin-like protein
MFNLIWGTKKKDVLHGSDDTDIIWGWDGNDYLFGGKGNDLILGGDGDDWLWGGSGAVGGGHGGKGSNVRYDDGDDWLYGGKGNDHIFGQYGSDLLFGNDGDDYISGGSGDDTIDGGRGHDTIDGGYGDDTIYGGKDIYGVFDQIYGWSRNPETGEAEWLYGNRGDNHIGYWGVGGDDTIEGGHGHDTIYGGYGDDTIYGDTMLSGLVASEYGGNGDDDTIYGGDGDDTIDGGHGHDTIYGGYGDDTIKAGTNDHPWIDADHCGDGMGWGYGYATGKWLPSKNKIEGGHGNDTIEGGNGNDLIFGEIDTTGMVKNETYFKIMDGKWVYVGGVDVASEYGGSGNDTIYGGGGDDTIYGGYGDDTIEGGNGDDAIDGGNGDDAIDGGYGNDTFVYTTGDGMDVIDDFTQGEDVIMLDYYGIANWDDLSHYIGGDSWCNAVITFSEEDSLTLTDVAWENLEESDFVFTDLGPIVTVEEASDFAFA